VTYTGSGARIHSEESGVFVGIENVEEEPAIDGYSQ
jgi:hypothetical protein